jgi:hypothetical protein
VSRTAGQLILGSGSNRTLADDTPVTCPRCIAALTWHQERSEGA